MKENENLDLAIPVYDSSKKFLFDQEDIKKFLPHRDPFLFVDEISEIELSGDDKDEIGPGSYIVGIKKAKFHEKFPVFEGHFPLEPIFPGVLLLECMAQIGGVLILHKKPGKHSTYLTGMNHIKFKNKVIPGDVVIFKIELIWKKSGFVCMKGKGYVDQKCVVEAEIKAQIIENLQIS